jgi:hypothetical protein
LVCSPYILGIIVIPPQDISGPTIAVVRLSRPIQVNAVSLSEAVFRVVYAGCPVSVTPNVF